LAAGLAGDGYRCAAAAGLTCGELNQGAESSQTPGICGVVADMTQAVDGSPTIPKR